MAVSEMSERGVNIIKHPTKSTTKPLICLLTQFTLPTCFFKRRFHERLVTKLAICGSQRIATFLDDARSSGIQENIPAQSKASKKYPVQIHSKAVVTQSLLIQKWLRDSAIDSAYCLPTQRMLSFAISKGSIACLDRQRSINKSLFFRNVSLCLLQS